MVVDSYLRPLEELRISVTDRCNFRCHYCMPHEHYQWIEKSEILQFEEIVRLVNIFVECGVKKLHLTGGEPLLRNEIEKLVSQLVKNPRLEDIVLITNGTLLAQKAFTLKEAGLKRLTVSLDTLDPEKFAQISQYGKLNKVLEGLEKAREIGFDPIKINMVVVRGSNDNEILELARFSREGGFHLRFIEYMDVGNSNSWDLKEMVSKEEILKIIHSKYPLQEFGTALRKGTENRYRYLDGKGEIGIISSVTDPFCDRCGRARLTADGKLVTCLFSKGGLDLRTALRKGLSDSQIKEIILGLWKVREDQYSKDRWFQIRANQYRWGSNQKIEMITLGG